MKMVKIAKMVIFLVTILATLKYLLSAVYSHYAFCLNVPQTGRLRIIFRYFSEIPFTLYIIGSPSSLDDCSTNVLHLYPLLNLSKRYGISFTITISFSKSHFSGISRVICSEFRNVYSCRVVLQGSVHE